MFWRITFWVVIIHLVLCGLPAAVMAPTGISTAFPLAATGFAMSVALLVVENSEWVLTVLVFSDLVSLWLIWGLAHGRWHGRLLSAHLCTIGAILAVHIAATVYLAYRGQAPYPLSHDELLSFLALDLLLAIPATLLLVGSIFRKTQPPPGSCATCGYDLRASKDRCPECGTPIRAPARAEVGERLP